MDQIREYLEDRINQLEFLLQNGYISIADYRECLIACRKSIYEQME